MKGSRHQAGSLNGTERGEGRVEREGAETGQVEEAGEERDSSGQLSTSTPLASYPDEAPSMSSPWASLAPPPPQAPWEAVQVEEEWKGAQQK